MVLSIAVPPPFPHDLIEALASRTVNYLGQSFSVNIVKEMRKIDVYGVHHKIIQQLRF